MWTNQTEKVNLLSFTELSLEVFLNAPTSISIYFSYLYMLHAAAAQTWQGMNKNTWSNKNKLLTYYWFYYFKQIHTESTKTNLLIQ